MPTLAECLLVRRKQRSLRARRGDTDVAALVDAAQAGGRRRSTSSSIASGVDNAKLIRDVAVELGIPRHIEDSWGGDPRRPPQPTRSQHSPHALFAVAFMTMDR